MLSDCELGNDGVIALCSGLSINKGVNTLNLAKNKIEDGALIYVSESLKRNFYLTNFDLSNNILHNRGGLALANCIKTNMTLTALNLSMNNFKDIVGC